MIDAFATSADGSIAVGQAFNANNKGEAFRFTDDFGTIALGTLPSADPSSEARAVSADGSVVVGESNGPQAFLWTEASGPVSLGFNRNGNAVSGDGEIILGTDRITHVAIFWINGNGPFDLRDYLLSTGVPVTFTKLTQALSISGDGTWVCGYGRTAGGETHGFVSRLPRTLGPHSIRVNIQKPVFGSVSGGDRRSTFKSDDERLEITNGVVPSNTLSPVTWEIEGTAARLTPSKLEFTLEAQVSRSGLSQTIDLWNHQTQTWQTVDSRAATQTDSTVTIERTTDATQFVRPQDGKVKARIRYKATAPGASSTWKARIDHARWTAHP